MKVKEEGEEAGLKINIQKTKIMASSPITTWQIDGEAMGHDWETELNWTDGTGCHDLSFLNAEF